MRFAAVYEAVSMTIHSSITHSNEFTYSQKLSRNKLQVRKSKSSVILHGIMLRINFSRLYSTRSILKHHIYSICLHSLNEMALSDNTSIKWPNVYDVSPNLTLQGLLNKRKYQNQHYLVFSEIFT